MTKIGRNEPCPCGSGKKFKKCCFLKKPRKQSILVGSPVPIGGLHYDKDKMKFKGLTQDGHLIETNVTFSQTSYNGQSGKEKVVSRVHDKVIPDQADLFRHLSSSFDLIIGIDTNTKIIDSQSISVSGVIHCIVNKSSDPDRYLAGLPWRGGILFRNCPSELHPEKFGWITEIKRINSDPQNRVKKFALITDHDLGNHMQYNKKQMPVYGDFYMPDNFLLMYGRGDSSNENLLNYLVKQCDKKSTELIKGIEENGYYQNKETRVLINQIPVPNL